MACRDWVGTFAAVAVLAGAQPSHAAECKLSLVAELKVEPGTRRPTLQGGVDGVPVSVLLDTGAQASMLSAAAAKRAKLTLMGGGEAYGLGGNVVTTSTVIPRLTLAGLTLASQPIGVVRADMDVDMILGSDLFSQWELELDLPHGFVRLLTVSNCPDDQVAYWGHGSYALAPLLPEQGVSRYIVQVKLNGRPVDALIDSGSSRSIVTPRLARSAGAQVEDGVEGSVRGLAGRPLAVHIAKFDSFSIGEEAVRNVKLQVAEINQGVGFATTGSRISQSPDDQVEMILGADFLRAHRVVLSQRRAKAYVAYTGGPVFRIDDAPLPRPTAPAPTSSKPGS